MLLVGTVKEKCYWLVSLGIAPGILTRSIHPSISGMRMVVVVVALGGGGAMTRWSGMILEGRQKDNRHYTCQKAPHKSTN